MPVMEGKCALFKRFGNVDAIPLCVRSKNVDEIVETVRLIAGSFGGVNLEDISAPRCFEIERRLNAVIFRFSTMTSTALPLSHWQLCSTH